MQNTVIGNSQKIKQLQNRVAELERQLAEAQAVISALTSPKRQNSGHKYEQAIQKIKQEWEEEKAEIFASEERLQSALMIAPYPLMIRREDGKVVMINAAWTEMTGYRLDDIPTIEEWTRKAYGVLGSQRQSLIINEGFSQTGVKKWGEFEVTTRSGEKRIWDFSTAPLGFDENGRELVMTMAVDVTDRKQTEERLRASRDEAAWLARLPGENPNPVARVSDTGIVLYHNPPAANLPGWTCALNEPLPIPLLPLVQEALKQGRLVEENVSLDERLYAVSVVPILGEGYLNIYGRDVTEGERAEEARHESEQRLNHAQEIAHLGSWELDLINNRLTWSDEVYRIFGLQPQEFGATYEAFLEAVHPEDRSAVDNAYSNSIREGRDTYEIEHRVIKRSSGEVRIVHEKCEHFRDPGGKIIRSVGMVHDITERKQAEQALRESEARYRGLMESQLDLIVRVDPEGRFTFVNDAYCQKFGLKREEILGRESYKPLVHPEDLPHTLEAMKALYQPPYRIVVEQRAFAVEGVRWIE